MKSNLTKAIEALNDSNCTCVACKGDLTYTSTKRGVKPLLDWLDSKVDLTDFSAADKVVGKAAAFLYVLLGVKEVYAHVMSEASVDTLNANGISARCDTTVENIINRFGTGICPMEQAVRDISDPSEALEAIRFRLAELEKSR